MSTPERSTASWYPMPVEASRATPAQLTLGAQRQPAGIRRSDPRAQHRELRAALEPELLRARRQAAPTTPISDEPGDHRLTPHEGSANRPAERAAQNLTTTLALVMPGPTRILKDGAILVAPNVQHRPKVSYVGSDVQTDSLASGQQHGGPFDDPQQLRDREPHRHDESHCRRTLPTGTTRSSRTRPSLTLPRPGEQVPAMSSTRRRAWAIVTRPSTAPRRRRPMRHHPLLHWHDADERADHRHYLRQRRDDLPLDGRHRHGAVGGVQVFVATAARPPSATMSTTVQYRIYPENEWECLHRHSHRRTAQSWGAATTSPTPAARP